MSLLDTIKEKQEILDRLKPGQFNKVKYWLANVMLAFGILYSLIFGFILLIIVIPIYAYLVYNCVDWKAHERTVKW